MSLPATRQVTVASVVRSAVPAAHRSPFYPRCRAEGYRDQRGTTSQENLP